MCQICLEFQKHRLSIREAYANLEEMQESMPEEHYDEVMEMIDQAAELEYQKDFFLTERDYDESDFPVDEQEEIDSLWNENADLYSTGDE